MTKIVFDQSRNESFPELKKLEDIPDDLPADSVVIDEATKKIGGFADVLKGTCQGRVVACKSVRVMKEIPPTIMNRRFQRETRVWCKLSHDNIVTMLGLYSVPRISKYKLMISLWCEYGDLGSFLERFQEAPDNLPMVLRFYLLCGVLSGIAYLHSLQSPIVHGDLKPANILLAEDLTPKLCDFGLVRVIHENGVHSGFTTTSNHLGTTCYLAPELLVDPNSGSKRFPWLPSWLGGKGKQIIVRPTLESDIWAFATIGVEIMASVKPYAHIEAGGQYQMLALLNEIKAAHPPVQKLANSDPVVAHVWKRVLTPAWSKKPKSRPTAEGIQTILGEIRTDQKLPEEFPENDPSVRALLNALTASTDSSTTATPSTS